jgi:hypothetical protein
MHERNIHSDPPLPPAFNTNGLKRPAPGRGDSPRKLSRNQLDTTIDDDEFRAKFHQGLGGGLTAIDNGDKIGYAVLADLALSLTQPQHARSFCRYHSIQFLTIYGAGAPGNLYLVNEIACSR